MLNLYHWAFQKCKAEYLQILGIQNRSFDLKLVFVISACTMFSAIKFHRPLSFADFQLWTGCTVYNVAVPSIWKTSSLWIFSSMVVLLLNESFLYCN